MMRKMTRNFSISRPTGPVTKSAENGQTLLEVALLTPLLLLLLVGIFEVGRFAYYSIEVSNAARAAVQYGAQSLADAKDTPKISLAATNDSPDLSGLTVNSTVLCACSESPSSYVPCPALGCTGHPVVFIQVDTNATIMPFFHYPGFPTTFPVNGHAMMRVAQ
jgi:Flp pilus assembly protein TadG